MTIIEVWLMETSLPITHINVENAYTKGKLYCVMHKDNTVWKYPIQNIFRVKESYNVEADA